jgi:hypothetical protein
MVLTPGLMRRRVPTLLLQEDFDNSSLAARGWYDNNGSDILTTDYAGGGGCLRAAFATAGTQPSWIALRHQVTATDTIYLAYWVKYSSNWVGSGLAYHPHEWYILSDLDDALDGGFTSLADNYLTTYIETNYSSGGRPRVQFQDNRNINPAANVFRTGGGTISGTDVVANTETRSIGGANGGVEDGFQWESFVFGTSTGYYNDKQITDSVRFQPSPGTGYKNNWNLVEVYIAMNSINAGVAQHDGILRYWFNGTLTVDRSDMLLRTNAHPTLMFKQIVLAPYIGDGSPATQNILYDHLIVQTARPAVVHYPVRSVTVSPSAPSITAGGTQQLTATLADPQGGALTGRVVTWGTSNASLATVDGAGLVTGVAAGAVTITATCEGVPGTSSVTVTATGSPLFPLVVNGRFLQAATGAAFLMAGEAPWSLMVQPTNAEVTTYLNDRQAKGYNTLLCNLIEHKFTTNPPNNILGVAPFTTPDDFSTPNETYFARCASIIADCANRGILVALNPSYMGVIGGTPTEGWYDVMVANGTTKLTNYGTYVANRFLAYDNILWVHGTDRPTPTLSILNAIPNAIRAVTTKWLHTFQENSETVGRTYAGGQSWFAVDTVYSYTNFVGLTAQEYAASPIRPVIQIESRYENETGGTALLMRQQAYQTILSGACGHIYGNNPIWFFGSGWASHLNDAGGASLQYLPPVFTALP